MLHRYTTEMPRPKGQSPPREYVSARIRKDLLDELTEITASGNPSRSQAIEIAVEMYLKAARKKSDKREVIK